MTFRLTVLLSCLLAVSCTVVPANAEYVNLPAPQQRPAAIGERSAETYQETAEERAACTGDVYRLCMRYVPSRSAITRCLEGNLDQLSPRCAAVISR